MSGADGLPMLPEDSFVDPEFGFGESELIAEPLTAEPQTADPVHDITLDSGPDPETLNEDADVPLDVEPDADLRDRVDFEQTATEPAPKPINPEQLKLELQSARAELAGLRHERDELLRLNRDLNQRLEAAPPADEVARLESALKDVQRKHNAAEDDARDLRRELDRASAQLQQAAQPPQPAPDARLGMEMMDAQLRALQDENTQLKAAIAEARNAEARAGHAHAELSRRNEQLEEELESTRAEARELREQLDTRIRENEQTGRELALARKELADGRDAGDEVQRRLRELDDRRAELAQVTRALAEARAEIERLGEFEREMGRVSALEDKITALQQQLLEREKNVAELQEKLDTEAARSYRLSQRRIPALNRELEETQEHMRDTERKLQKAELKAATFEEQASEFKNQIAELERALQGAKARAHDTQMITPADTAPGAVVEDEVRRLSNRLREAESERARLIESFARLSASAREDAGRLETRMQRLEKESDERFERLLGQRTTMRVLRDRVQGLLKLAEDIAQSDGHSRKPLLETARKLAELPPDTE